MSSAVSRIVVLPHSPFGSAAHHEGLVLARARTSPDDDVQTPRPRAAVWAGDPPR